MTSKYIPETDLVLNKIPVTQDAGRSDLNSLGYDCEEFGGRRDFNLMFLGCSWTQGHHDTGSFTQRVADHYAERYGVTVNNWNLALGARSADYMSRTLLCSVDVLKPDMLFVVFTTLDRREYFRNDGKKMNYLVAWIDEERNNGQHWRVLTQLDKALIRHMNGLISPYDDTMNFVQNYKLIEMACELRGIPWGFSMLPSHFTVEPILELIERGWVDGAKYLGKPFEIFDHLSETDHHPGVESQKAFGKLVFDWLDERHAGYAQQKIAQNKATRG